MGWLRLTLTVPRRRLSAVESELRSLGALSITLSDAANEPIIEPDPGATPVWPTALVAALFEDGAGVGDELRAFAARWSDASQGAAFEIAPVEERDWSATWREGLVARCFADALWVCPSYAPAPADGRPVLVMDPGLAFGTGNHPTTELCLTWLAEQKLRDRVVIDYGCGSGILALAARLLGAGRVCAVDHDPQALQSTRANLERNGLDPGSIWIGPPQALPELHCDLLVANLFSRVLMELSDQFTKLLLPFGKLALCGVLNEQCAAVKRAFPGIEFLDVRTEGEWALLVGNKREPA